MKATLFRKLIAGAMAAMMAATALTGLTASAEHVGNWIELDLPDVYPANKIEDISATQVRNKVEGLLRAMTKEEKYSLLGGIAANQSATGDGTGYLKGIPRLGVPEIRMWDGPRGIISNGALETTLPASEMSVASSFSEQVAYNYGVLHGKDNKATAGNVQLGPQLDHVRSPLFMRSRDSYGEDPYLTAILGGRTAEGMEDENAMAVVKHMAGYTTMFTHTDDPVVMDEQTLHELYLAPYERIAKNNQASAIMTSFNFINGTHAPSNSYLLKDVLRDMWGFRGTTMTDWNSIKKLSLKEGMDLEMGYINKYSPENVDAAIAAGEITMDDVDTAVRHTLTAIGQIGYLGLCELNQDGVAAEDPTPPAVIQLPRLTGAEREALLDANNELALESSLKGAVLMKNDAGADSKKALPLDASKSIGVIGLTGLNGFSGAFMESSFGSLRRMISPYDSLKSILGDSATINKAVGIDIFGETIPAQYLFTDAAATQNGVNFVKNGVTTKLNMLELTTGTIDGKVNQTYKNSADGNALVKGETATMSAYLKAPVTGEYEIKMLGIGGDTRATMVVDGANKTANQTQKAWGSTNIVRTPEGMDVPTSGTKVSLVAGTVYKIDVTLSATVDAKDLQMRMTWFPPNKAADDKAAALQVAQNSKTVVFFAHDIVPTDAGFYNMTHRANWYLRNGQEELLKEVVSTAKAAGNKVVVVLNIGLPVLVKDWIDDVDAVLNMWFPGQAGGVATAQLLTGVANPSGKLSITFPKNTGDTPLGDPSNFSNMTKISTYSEGIYSGYRWYDHEDIEPQFAFGSGLSYTNFTYSDLRIQRASRTDNSYNAIVTVTNDGNVKGSEVVELFLGAANVPAGVQMADFQLAGFARVDDLAPGASKTVTIPIEERYLCYWDVNKTVGRGVEKWTLATGQRTVYVGGAKPVKGSANTGILTQTINVGFDQAPTTVEFALPMVTLQAGNTATLKATVTPSGASETLSWISSNTGVATVDQNGVVTGVAEGTATITVTLQNGNSASCTINVRPKAAAYKVDMGQQITLPITVEDCRNLAGISGVLSYNQNLLSLETVIPAKGFSVQFNGNKFIASSATGYNGSVIIGYAVFTAKTGLSDDVTTYINFPADKITAANADLTSADVVVPSLSLLIMGPKPILGDVNLDGKVDVYDTILLMRYLAGSETLTDRQLRAADVNRDGKVNIGDVTIIMQIILDGMEE